MSVTLATVADALIEFILSLLRDPDEAARFDAAPHTVLASHGLAGVQAHHVSAVAPIIVERPDVTHVLVVRAGGDGAPHAGNDDPVVREIRSIVNNLSYVDDRDTLVDQSVNQNIWAEGDVTQNFDQSAVVASGDEAMAAGNDFNIDQTEDNSSTITAGDDVNVGNDTTTDTVDDSYNTTTDASTATDASTTTDTADSSNDDSTTTTIDHSFDSTATQTTDATADVSANAVVGSTDTVVVDDSSATVADAASPDTSSTADTSSAAQYVDATVDVDDSSAYDSGDATFDDADADDGL